MKIRNQDILIPTSMVGNYPNPRWWDAEFARYFTGDQAPPDSLWREALEDAVGDDVEPGVFLGTITPIRHSIIIYGA